MSTYQDDFVIVISSETNKYLSQTGTLNRLISKSSRRRIIEITQHIYETLDKALNLKHIKKHLYPLMLELNELNSTK